MARAPFAPLFAIMLWLAASPATATVKPVTTPFLRGTAALNHMSLDPKGRFLAYIGDDGLGLSVIDIKTRNIFKVTDAQVGGSFFWSPDGFRLFYREQSKTPPTSDGKAATNEVTSVVKAYDCALGRSVVLDEIPMPTGLLTFDPRDLRMHLMSPKGIRTKRIYFPDERLARWQVAQRNEAGKWLATQAGILWVTQGGYAMRRLEDDDTGLDSFDIAPDGDAIAWATKGGKIYMMRSGKPVTMVGYGRDPKWHPEKPRLVYAGARMVGNRAASYDLRVVDGNGTSKWLTSTQHSDERWPHWHPDGNQVIYTMSRTTDVFLVDFAQ